MRINRFVVLYACIGTTQVLVNDTFMRSVLINQVEAAIRCFGQYYSLLQLGQWTQAGDDFRRSRNCLLGSIAFGRLGNMQAATTWTRETALICQDRARKVYSCG